MSPISRFVRHVLAPSAALCLAGTTAFAQEAAESAKLDTITVSGQRQQYVGTIPVKDLPQNIQTLEGDQLKEIGITRLDDALDLVSGVARQNNFGGLWDSFAVRGFAGDSNVPSGFLVNGFNAGRGFGGPRDASNVERIDILKGPTSALFGRGEPGGTVNIITKKPQFTPEGHFTLQGGSFSTYRGEADYTSPITDTLAFRINGAYEDGNSYRDTVDVKKYTVTPSFLWKIGSSDSLSYEVERSSQDVPFDRGVPILNNDFDRLPASRYLGEPGDGPIKVNSTSHQLQFQHDFTSDWGVLFGAGYRDTDLKGYGESPEFAAARQKFFTDGRTLARQRRFSDYTSTDTTLRSEVNGQLQTAGLTHHILIGADYDDFKLDQFQNRYRPPAWTPTSTLAQMNAIDVLNPVYTPAALLPVPNALVYNKLEKDETGGAYLQDQIDITARFKIRLGGRYDKFKQSILNRANSLTARQDVTAFSPQGGVVFEPTPALSLYASYGKGFRPNTGTDFFNNPFAPERTKSYEVGAKYATFDRALSTTVAVFKMDKDNIITADPIHSGFVIAIGTARSKGVELDLDARLPWDMHAVLAYAYIEAESTSSVQDPDFGKVVAVGDPLINVPKNAGSLILSRDFQVAGREASLGAGLNYVSERLGETGTPYMLPSYTLVRIMGSYGMTDKFKISADVNNLFNRRWYASSYAALWTYPGATRQFAVRLNYSF